MMCEILGNPNTLKGAVGEHVRCGAPVDRSRETGEGWSYPESGGCPLRLRACPDGDLRGKNT